MGRAASCARMPSKGMKRPGHDSLPTADGSAEVSEADLKEGQRRKGGQSL